MNYKFKALSLKDLGECINLYTVVFNSEPWQDGWKEDDVKERLTDLFMNRKFLGIGVYNSEQIMIGFSLGYTERWLNSNHFNLNEMCIKPEYQNEGVGSELMTQLETTCEQQHISRIYLLTARAGQAEAFYKKNGYDASPKMIMMSKELRIHK